MVCSSKRLPCQPGFWDEQIININKHKKQTQEDTNMKTIELFFGLPDSWFGFALSILIIIAIVIGFITIIIVLGYGIIFMVKHITKFREKIAETKNRIRILKSSRIKTHHWEDFWFSVRLFWWNRYTDIHEIGRKMRVGRTQGAPNPKRQNGILGLLLKITFCSILPISLLLVVALGSPTIRESLIYQVIIGSIILLWLIVTIESIYIPGPRQIKIITIFGKVYRVIANVHGKKIYTGPKNAEHDTWDLVDLGLNEEKGSNIYFFFPWPFYKVYKYQFVYTKPKKIGEEESDDVVVWENKETKECVVSRKGISDHVEYRVEYPIISPSLDTGGDENELGTINLYTLNVLETVNAVKMLFGISSWFSLATESLNGVFRGIVAKNKIVNLNKLASESKAEFNDEVCKANKIVPSEIPGEPDHPGLLEFGVKVIKSVFKDFDPADEKTRTLVASYTDIQTNKNKGVAKYQLQQGETDAFLLQNNAEIEMAKKKLLETGRIKTEDGTIKGKITELVPDPDTKVLAENLGKLATMPGTLVIGEKTANMLNLNPKAEQK